MAGVVNNCRHCNATIYDGDTAKKHCVECGQPDWDKHRVSKASEEKTITVYTITEMADEEGRRWYTLDTCFDEQSALKIKGNSGYRRIVEKTVYIDPPLLRGIEVSQFLSLPRYPINQALKDKKALDKIKSKLSAEELRILKDYYAA